MSSAVAATHFRLGLLMMLLSATLFAIEISQLQTDQGRWDSDSGRLAALYSQNLQLNTVDHETELLSFLHELYLTRFGVDTESFISKLEQVYNSPAGAHYHFRLYWKDMPVHQSWSQISVDNFSRLQQVILPQYVPGEIEGGDVTLSAEDAVAIALELISEDGNVMSPPTAELTVYPVPHGKARLVYRILAAIPNPPGDWEVLVDAGNGTIHMRNDRACYIDGSGFVFNPDPLTTARVEYGGEYRDMDDQDVAVLNEQRVEVPLRDIQFDGQFYHLSGPYVSIKDFEPPYFEPVAALTPDGFFFTRSEEGFEEVSAYYHIDHAQRYLQSLGFKNIQASPIEVDAHGLNGMDNSHYLPDVNRLAFGDGGVDDAEDADVIYHEYGHAVHWDQLPEWGGGDMAAIAEGFCDYWAGTFSAAVSDFNSNWVYNWDGHNEFRAGRVLDYPGIYPDNWIDDRYHDGQIWSSALWQIRNEIGNDEANRVIIQSHYFLTYGATVEDAAQSLLLADEILNGGLYRESIGTVLFNKGFIAEIPVYGSLDGNVSDLNTGLPIEQAQVTIDDHYSTETGPDGLFEFPAVSIGFHRIAVNAPSYSPWEEIVEIEEGVNLHIPVQLGQSRLESDVEEIVIELFLDSTSDTTITISNRGYGDATWHAELANGIIPAGNTPPLLRSIPVSDLTGDHHLFGIEVLDGQFILSGANNLSSPNMFYTVSAEGELLTSCNQPTLTAWGFRDLVNIDGLIYGSDSRWITGVDDNCIPVDSIDGPHNPNRSLAWDVEQEILWSANQSTRIVGIDRAGEELAAIDHEYAITAMAWNPWDPSGTPLYIFHQATGMDSVGTICTPYNPEVESGGEYFQLPRNSRHELVVGASISNRIEGFGDSWIMAVLVEDTLSAEFKLDLIRLSESVPWLDVSPRFGIIMPDEDQELILNLDSHGFRAGFHYSSLLLRYDGAESPLILPISMRVFEVSARPVRALPERLKISAPWPNPSNGVVALDIKLPNAETVELKVFNVLGELVSVSNATEYDAGSHRISWMSSDNIPSGVYFLQARAGAESRVFKFVMVR